MGSLLRIKIKLTAIKSIINQSNTSAYYQVFIHILKHETPLRKHNKVDFTNVMDFLRSHRTILELAPNGGNTQAELTIRPLIRSNTITET